MLLGKRIAVVLPAYNAGRTLRRTYAEIPHDIVDDVILTDDASRDDTVEVARQLGIHTLRHDCNLGYGGNQKTCYRAALTRGADIVIMLHPDYQYSPRLVAAMASMVASGHYDLVMGSRILGKGALKGGMPRYKYVFNRALTFIQNIMIDQKLSEYHTGFRAWSRSALEPLPILNFSDDFVFDNEIVAAAQSAPPQKTMGLPGRRAASAPARPDSPVPFATAQSRAMPPTPPRRSPIRSHAADPPSLSSPLPNQPESLQARSRKMNPTHRIGFMESMN